MAVSGLPALGDLLAASERATTALVDRLGSDGLALDSEARRDVASLYRLPTQLLLSGRGRECNLVLDAIKANFMQPDGDFVSFPEEPWPERKTANVQLSYNWPYVNGWIVMAAQRAGRFDIAVPAFRYVLRYRQPQTGGFLWHQPFQSPASGPLQSACAFMTSHLGYVCLFMGAMTEAWAAGDYLVRFLAAQPSLATELLMKTDCQGKCITDFPTGKDTFFAVKRTGSGYERYYQLGYPVFFLHRLYLATEDSRYLDTAKALLDFAESCDSHLYTYAKSHTVAYGAAAVWSSTREERHRKLALRIAGNMLSHQAEDGLFLPRSPFLERLDQSAENAEWLREIYNLLS